MSKKLNKKLMKLAKGGSSNQPLVVVDGLVVGSVETLEILKDAASTAIYGTTCGARAANGVILVTCKRPTAGVKTLTSADAAKK